MIDRSRVQIITNLGSNSAEFDVPAEYRVLAQSNSGIAVNEGKISLPGNSLAILSNEDE